MAGIDDLDVLATTAFAADLSEVRPVLADALRALRSAGVALSDRRCVKCQRLVGAAGALDGRRRPDGRDLWPIVFAVPDADGQRLAREVLESLLVDSRSAALAAAAEEASGSRFARAERLARLGSALLEEAGISEADGPTAEASRLRLEGLAREIDATFARDELPSSLAAVRERLVALLRPDA